MENKPANKKVFDIRRPGKAPPDTTSRSGIVTNRAVVRDNVLTLEDKQDKQPTEPPVDNTEIFEGAVLPLSHPERNITHQKSAMRLTIKWLVRVLIFVLAVVVAINILIDAEIIDTDLKPIVDLIKN